MIPWRKAPVLLIGLAASLALAPAAPAQEAVEQEIGLLFSQTAKRGTLDEVPGKDRYRLRLSGVSQTVWFQDRPARHAGQMPTAALAEYWPAFGFRDDPPNAALTVLDAADHQDTAVLTLGEPVYNAESRTIRYPAVPLQEASGNLAGFDASVDPRVPRQFDHASLFIDDAVGMVFGNPPICAMTPFGLCPFGQFHGAQLPRSKLQFAKLGFSDFSAANLSNSNFTGASLVGANLAGANLSGSIMDLANLREANLRGAILAGVDQRYVVFCGTTMPNGTISNRNC